MLMLELSLGVNRMELMQLVTRLRLVGAATRRSSNQDCMSPCAAAVSTELQADWKRERRGKWHQAKQYGGLLRQIYGR